MESIEFKVKGSAAEPYSVRITHDAEGLTATCTCQAAVNKQACKHRLSILNGKTTGIVSSNLDKVASVVGWLKGTNLAAALSAVEKAEADYEIAQSARKNAMKELGARLVKH